MKRDIADVLSEFFKILDRRESSEDGTVFRPTYISSCRTFDLMKLNEIIDEMKEYTREVHSQRNSTQVD